MAKSRKSFHPSTMSRRDFMKLVGMGTIATAGGVMIQKPFKDLDEMMASPYAERKLPWWVKEVDEPTVNIDWDNMEIFPGFAKTLFRPENWPEGEWQKIQTSNIESTTENVKNNVPGYSLRDRALGDANCWGWAISSIAPSWTGPDVHHVPVWEHPTMFYTPEDFGVPKYQGSPEENSRMLRVAGRVLGAADMGFVKLDERTKKLLYGFVQFEDVDQGYQKEDGTSVLPSKKDLWVVVSLIPQSLWMAQYTDRMSWAQSNTAAYSRAGIYSNRLKVFLRGLGYQHYGGGTGSVGRAVGFGVMAGLAEYGRAGIMVSPQFGTNFRTVMLTVTDLPLAVTKPIDAGITNFCRTCMKCAGLCPSGAISLEKDAFWGGGAEYQAKGIEGWYLDAKKCYAYMLGGDPDCSRCQADCPFSKFDEAVMHDLVKATIASTPVLNSALRELDDVFGYGQPKDSSSSPWDVDPMDIPLFGLDPSRS